MSQYLIIKCSIIWRGGQPHECMVQGTVQGIDLLVSIKQLSPARSDSFNILQMFVYIFYVFSYSNHETGLNWIVTDEDKIFQLK